MVKHDAPGVRPLADFTTVEDVLAGLRQRGGRATPARRLLLVALFRDRRHRSAEELAAEVQAQSPDRPAFIAGVRRPGIPWQSAAL